MLYTLQKELFLQDEKSNLFWVRVLSRKCALQRFHPKYLSNCYRSRQSLFLIFIIGNSQKIEFIVPIMDCQIKSRNVS